MGTTMQQCAALALALPHAVETTSYGHRAWSVEAPGAKRTRAFAWDRPFSKADLKRFGDDPVPGGDILAVRLADLGEKEAVLAEHPDVAFTIPHLDGHPIVLVRVEVADRDVVADLLQDGWSAAAPAATVEEYLRRT